MTEYVVDLTDKQTTDLRKVRHERIVRCRDCKHGDPFCECSSYPGKINCLHFAQWDYYDDEMGVFVMEPSDFCSYGVMKESPGVQMACECDRDALLKLADEMDSYTRCAEDGRCGKMMPPSMVFEYVRRIREALGEES